MFFFINCHNKENFQEIALLDSYTVHQNGRYNLNIYLLDKYNKRKSLKENLESQDSIRCYILIVDKKKYNHIEKLKEKIHKQYILCDVSVKLVNDKYHEFKVEKNIIKIQNSKFKCDFYMVFDDFDSFKINTFLNDGIDSIHLVE